MKKIGLLAVLAIGLASCAGKKEEKKEETETIRTKTEVKTETASEGVPVDLNNKGVGPISSYKFSEEVNTEMAAAGEKIYGTKCTICHMADQRMIGPALSGVYDRRSPEWVLNMLLNPEGMLKEDPIAIAMLKEYNGAIMTNSNLSDQEAKEVAEYLRTL